MRRSDLSPGVPVGTAASTQVARPDAARTGLDRARPRSLTARARTAGARAAPSAAVRAGYGPAVRWPAWRAMARWTGATQAQRSILKGPAACVWLCPLRLVVVAVLLDNWTIYTVPLPARRVLIG